MARNDKNTITISTPQSILLLGDLAANYDFGSISISVDPRITQSITRINGKTSFIHFLQQNIHVELTQLTPIIPKETPRLIHQLINLAHAILIEMQLPYGVDIRVQEFISISKSTAVATFICGLIDGVSKIGNTVKNKEELLDIITHYTKQLTIKIPRYVLANAVFKGIVFCEANQTQSMTLDDLMLMNIALNMSPANKIANGIQKHISLNQKKYQPNIDQLSKLAILGKTAFEKSDITKLGEYINRTEKILTDLGLVSDESHKVCIQAMLCGALGAKYSMELNQILIVCDRQGIKVKAELMKRGLEVKEISINLN